MQPRITPEDSHRSFPHLNRCYLWGIVGVLLLIPIAYNLTQTYFFYYVPEALPLYSTSTTHHDDTLRIAFIGDSWADYHTSLCGDTMIKNAAKTMFDKPIKTATRGKKGALSKEVYYFMYSSKTTEHSYEPDRCTQPLIEDHPDYCVVFAGINDVTFLRSTSYYAENIRLIINLLLHNQIRPIVFEIPTLNFTEPMTRTRTRERWFYYIRSILMGTKANQVTDYREALKEMLTKNNLKDSILYLGVDQWNPKGNLDTTMFLEDRLHLNLNGYHCLDSCIATEIIKDYQKRKSGNLNCQ